MLFDLVMPGEILGYLTARSRVNPASAQGAAIVATSNDKAVESLNRTIDYENGMISLGTYICGAVHGNQPQRLQELLGEFCMYAS